MVRMVNNSVNQDALFSAVGKLLHALTTLPTGAVLISPKSVVELLVPMIQEEASSRNLDISSDFKMATTFLKSTLYDVIYVTSYYADKQVGDDVIRQKFAAAYDLSLFMLNQVIKFGGQRFRI
ncbi:MAG: hypothetical protein LBP35_02160 [Candidatus Ancillula trichonymphae]|nr:hypothetical protein [Candidatus Ancillula trichonymphae]